MTAVNKVTTLIMYLIIIYFGSTVLIYNCKTSIWFCAGLPQTVSNQSGAEIYIVQRIHFK